MAVVYTLYSGMLKRLFLVGAVFVVAAGGVRVRALGASEVSGPDSDGVRCGVPGAVSSFWGVPPRGMAGTSFPVVFT